jgi:hypothetical protein
MWRAAPDDLFLSKHDVKIHRCVVTDESLPEPLWERTADLSELRFQPKPWSNAALF